MCLFSGTEKALKWVEIVSSLFPVNMGVGQECALVPSLFNTCVDWILGRAIDQNHCGTSNGNNSVTDLTFADDTVILDESLEVLVLVLEQGFSAYG